MPFVTVTRGGPSAETDIPDGIHQLVLVEIKDPRSVHANRGPNAGQDIDLIDWVWMINAPGTSLDERILESSTSTASGPKSKMYAYLTALFNGVAPMVGAAFEKQQLVGRSVLGTINHDGAGWPRVSTVSALPVQLQQQQFAQATGAPVQPAGAPAPAAAAPTPLRQAVAAGQFAGAPASVAVDPSRGDLPF